MNQYFKIFTLLSVLVLTACGGSSSNESSYIEFINDGTSFITTWKTDNEGVSESDQITITTATSDQNYTVHWGDGSQDTNVTGNITHTYASAGTYSVGITGDFTNFLFNTEDSDSDAKKLLTIEQWGDIQWSTMAHAFNGCENLVLNATDTPDLSQVTDMSYMFKDAKNFNGDISLWDVSSVTNMDSMFSSTAFNQDIGNWDVSSVTNMYAMFYTTSTFDQDISNWDVSSVTNMSEMFHEASAFNQAIGNWDVSAVTNMWGMFQYSHFNQDIGNWDVSSVLDMGGMFRASSFDQDIGNWDVSSVTNMYTMFMSNGFNQDISNWNVSSVTNMWGMFCYSGNFDQNIGNWDVSSVTDMAYMLYDITLSTTNYDALLNGWAAITVQNNVSFSGGHSIYSTTAETARSSLINTYGWTITDGGAE